jgi:hypothetical protein
MNTFKKILNSVMCFLFGVGGFIIAMLVERFITLNFML